MVVTSEKCTTVYITTCHLIVIIFYYLLLFFIYLFLIRFFTPTRVGLFLAISDGGPL